jgi:probable rRNA maturation factor
MGKPGRKSLSNWTRRANLRVARVLMAVWGVAELRKLAPAGQGVWQVSVKISSARAMASLNRRYLGKSYATDVLSFPAPEPFRGAGFLGELVVCEQVARRQAAEHGHGPELELDILLVHGVLHLLGLDHERSRLEATRMARHENRVLGRLGGPARGRGLIGRG